MLLFRSHTVLDHRRGRRLPDLFISRQLLQVDLLSHHRATSGPHTTKLPRLQHLREPLLDPAKAVVELVRAAVFEREAGLDGGKVRGDAAGGDGLDGGDPGVGADPGGGDVRVVQGGDGGCEGLKAWCGGGGEVDDLCVKC